MRIGFTFHQNGGPPGGRVQRRADRYQNNPQTDTRGQYPRPRDNQFAQPRPRVAPLPQQPAPPPPAPEPAPPVEVYTKDGVQYQRPARPYVPSYMKTAQNAQPEPDNDAPVRQEDYINRQNPYVVVSEKSTAQEPRVKQRLLIILTSAAAIILAGVLVCLQLFAAQINDVFTARAAAEEALERKHPYSYRELIEQEAYQNNLHPAFVAAIVLNESSFDPAAESYRGARGLMQLMEDTAQWVYDRIGAGTAYSFDLMYDAQTNVTYGCWYLNYLSEKFNGDPILVAAAFHSGQTNVQNWLSDKANSADQQTMALENMPDGNTKAYVTKVLNAFAVYRRLYYEEVAL